MNKQKGNISVIMALLLPMIIIILMAGIEFSRHCTLKMRLQHANDTALALIAREGAYVTQGEARYLAQTVLAYNVPTDLRDKNLKRTGDFKVNISPLGSSDNLSMRSELTGERLTQWLLPIKLQSHSQLQRYYQKKETVLVLDASRSMSSSERGGIKPVEIMREILPDFVESSLAPDNMPQDHLLAFVPYSTNVNLGFDYKKTLITEKSQRIPEYLRPLAKHYGYDNNFLNNRGVEGLRQGACVKRKFTNSASPLKQLGRYSGQVNGFDLLIYHNQEALSLFDLGDEIKDANNKRIPPHLLPVSQRYKGLHLETAGGCPSMPLTALTSNKKLLNERANMYWATHTTGGDEGLI